MPLEKLYQRMLDKDSVPTNGEILETIGSESSELWNELRSFLKESYDFQPQLLFYGLKYGWCYRYRRKKKTLCVLFPETRAFTILVTLGKKEIAEVENKINSFNSETQKVFNEAYQYHDGKWVYRRVLNKSDLDDILDLIRIKRRPKEVG